MRAKSYNWKLKAIGAMNMRTSLKVCSVIFAVVLIVSITFNIYFAWTTHNINRRIVDERTKLLDRVQLTLGMARSDAEGAFNALADEDWDWALWHLGSLHGHLNDLFFLLYQVTYFPEQECRVFAYGLRDRIDNASKIVLKVRVNLENRTVNELDMNFLAKLSEALRMTEQSIYLKISTGASEYRIDNVDVILAKFDEAIQAALILSG